MEKKYEKRLIAVLGIFLGIWSLVHVRGLLTVLGGLLDALFPILLGLSIAFVLHLPLGFLEKIWEKIIPKPFPRLRRVICLILTVALALGILALLLFGVLPKLFSALLELLSAIPQGLDRLWRLTEEWGIPLPFPKPDVSQMQGYLTELMNRYGAVLMELTAGMLLTAFGTVFDTVVAVVLALYVLAGRERLGGQLKRLLRALVKPKQAEEVLRITALTSRTFSKFLTGQVLEAGILGGLCFLGMVILNIPFAFLISVIVGVSALIPIFGAFIGIGVGGLLILSVDPTRALWFVIFLIVLQQLEGNLIYPRVVGRSVGLPGVWVLIAVTLGSALGFGWIFISVPAASVAYTLLRELVHRRMCRSGQDI